MIDLAALDRVRGQGRLVVHQIGDPVVIRKVVAHARASDRGGPAPLLSIHVGLPTNEEG